MAEIREIKDTVYLRFCRYCRKIQQVYGYEMTESDCLNKIMDYAACRRSLPCDARVKP